MGQPGEDVIRAAARAAGAVGAAARALRTHLTDANVQEAAADALTMLAVPAALRERDAAIVWAGAPHAVAPHEVARALVAAWSTHANHPCVPKAAARALAHLCREAPRGFAAAATRAGVAAPAARSLRRHAHDAAGGANSMLEVTLLALAACIAGTGVGTPEREDAMQRAEAAGVRDALACVSAPVQTKLSAMGRAALAPLLEWFPPRGEATDGTGADSSSRAAHASSAPPPAHSCASCGTTALPVKLCSSCRAARYCGAACQRAHWPAHKAACRAAAAAASAADSGDDE
jgi:hypothetical protein